MNGISAAFEREARLVEAAVALLRRPDHEMQIVVLNKALFYLDLLWYRDHGELLTKNPYIAMPQGPAIAGFERKLVKALETKNLAVQTTKAVGPYTAKPMKLVGDQADFHFKYLDKEALDMVSHVANALKPHTSTRLSEFSHENAAWLAAREQAQQGGPTRQSTWILPSSS